MDVQLGEDLSESLRGLQVCAIQHVISPSDTYHVVL